MKLDELAPEPGGPHIAAEWGVYRHHGVAEPLRKLTLRLILPGHEVAAYQRGYKREGEIGSLDLEQWPELPEYLTATGVGVDPQYRRLGHAEALYRRALELAKAAGFRGIASHRPGQRAGSGVAGLWRKLGARREGDYDVAGG